MTTRRPIPTAVPSSELRILLVRLRLIGDVAFTTPLIRAAFHGCVVVILIGLPGSLFDLPTVVRVSGVGYLALAAWRLASLVANEDGPWFIFKRFRLRAEQWCNKYRFCRELGLYELVSCEWCNSIWIGAGLMILYLWIGHAILYVAVPLALSTVAIIIKYIVQLLQSAQQFYETNNRSRQ